MQRLFSLWRVGRLLRLVFFCTVVLVSAAKAQQQQEKMVFKTKFDQSVAFTYEAERVVYEIKNGVLIVQGYIKHDETRWRLLKMNIQNFTGPGTYPLQAGQASWDNFSRDGICNCRTGEAVITGYDAQSGVLDGTFRFDCESYLNSGERVIYNIFDGEFLIKPRLGIEVTPDQPVTAKQTETVTFNILVRNIRQEPLQGAEVRVDDSIRTEYNKLIGTTDENGKLVYKLTIPKEQQKRTYGIRFWASKDDSKPSDTLARQVKVGEGLQVYQLKCNGVSVLEFDVGEGRIWNDAGNAAISTTGSVTINGFMTFEGLMEIDTTAGLENIHANGRLFIKNVQLPGGSTGDLPIYQGDEHLHPRCGIITAPLNNAANLMATDLFGMKVSIDEFSFIGGSPATGLKIVASMEIPGLADGCPGETAADYRQPKIKFTFEVNNNQIQNIVLGTDNISLAPGFCMNSLMMSYNSPRDSADMSFTLKTPAVTVTAGCGLVQGHVNSVLLRVDNEVAVPLGTTPFALKGAGGSITGLVAPPFMFSIGATLVPTVPAIRKLFEFDIDAKYKHPLIFEFSSGMRMVEVPGVGWQAIGTGTGTIDLNQSIGIAGTVKAGNLNSTKYVVEGNHSLQLVWEPTVELTGSVHGELNLPAVNSNAGWPWDWFNAVMGLPQTLANTDVALKNTVMKGNVDLTNSPAPYNQLGKIHFILNLEKSVGDSDFLDCGRGAIPLNSFVRDNDPVAMQRTADAASQQSLPLVRRSEAGKSERSLATEVRDTFTVDGSTMRVVVRLKSNTAAPASYLVTPGGEIITVGAEDDVAYNALPDNTRAFWTLMEPAEGNWTLVVTDPAATDSVDFYAIRRSRPLDINARTDGRVVTVTWDSTDAPADAQLDIFLDPDGEGFDGFYIGTAGESAGTFSYTFTDTLTGCLYHVHAVRHERGDMQRAYAPEVVANEKASLAPPMDIHADAAHNGRTRLTWKPSPDPDAVGYAVYVRDEAGHDSLYAVPYADEEQLELMVPDHGRKTIRLVAFNTEGRQGCFSEPVSITTGVDEQPAPGFTVEAEVLAIRPNPVSEGATIRFRVQESSRVRLVLFDLMGREVAVLADGVYAPGMHDVYWNAQGYPAGAVFVRLAIGAGQWTRTMMVQP